MPFKYFLRWWPEQTEQVLGPSVARYSKYSMFVLSQASRSAIYITIGRFRANDALAVVVVVAAANFFLQAGGVCFVK